MNRVLLYDRTIDSLYIEIIDTWNNINSVIKQLIEISLLRNNERIFFYKPITYNNPLKACFSNKKYLITIKTHKTQIEISTFLVVKP